jgi:hypothetical protein
VVVSYHLVDGGEHPRVQPVDLGVCGEGISPVLDMHLGGSAWGVLILDEWDRSVGMLWRHGR